MKTRESYLAILPPSVKGIIERAFSGEASSRAAIKAKCLDCCHFDRALIAACAVVICPLHAYRPYQPDGAFRNRRKGAENEQGEQFDDQTDQASPPEPTEGRRSLL